jgi:hypothetical protein
LQTFCKVLLSIEGLLLLKFVSFRSVSFRFALYRYPPVLSSFMSYHQVCIKSKMTGATFGAGTAYFSKISSPLKLLSQMSSKLVGSIYGRSSIRNTHFVDKMCTSYREPSIDASYQVSIHLAKQFQRRRFFRNQPIRNKNCLWRPCLLTDRDEISTLYRGLSIDVSYQVSLHLVKWIQRRRFF